MLSITCFDNTLTIKYLLHSYLCNEGSSRTTRAGTGINEGDELCYSCYMTFKRKFNAMQEGKHYSPMKSPIQFSSPQPEYKSKIQRSFSLPKRKLDQRDEDATLSMDVEEVLPVNQQIPDEDVAEDTPVKDEKCIMCSKGLDTKENRASARPLTITNNIRENISLLSRFNSHVIYCEDGTFIHRGCSLKLTNEANKIKQCALCRKPLHKRKRKKSVGSAATTKVTDQILQLISVTRDKEDQPLGENEYTERVHIDCVKKLNSSCNLVEEQHQEMEVDAIDEAPEPGMCLLLEI